MGQFKIYGIREVLHPQREKLSTVLHSCLVDALHVPKDKKFHRFIYIDRDSFYYPEGRTERYVIIELSIFEGRSVEAKKKLYQLVFERFEAVLGIKPDDVEITITETPMHNWGIRGKSADDLMLSYTVNV